MMQTSDIEGGGGGGLKVLRQCVSNLQAREQTSGCTFITITPSKASSSQYTLQFQRAGQPCAWTIIMGSGSQSIPDICFPSFEQSFEPSIDALLPVLDAWDGSTTSYTDFFAIVLKEYNQWHMSLISRHPCAVIRQLSIPQEAQVSCAPNETAPALFTVAVELPFTPPQPEKTTPLSQILLNAKCAVRLTYTATAADAVHTTARVLGLEGAMGDLALAERDIDVRFNKAADPADTHAFLAHAIKRAVDAHCKRFVASRVFVAAMISLLPGALLEYDDVRFTSCSFLIEVDQFHVLLHVRISSRFPEQQPTLILQSVYHDDAAGHPIRTQYSEYPYSPRWHGTELATRIRTFLLEEVPRFKQSSIKKHR